MHWEALWPKGVYGTGRQLELSLGENAIAVGIQSGEGLSAVGSRGGPIPLDLPDDRILTARAPHKRPLVASLALQRAPQLDSTLPQKCHGMQWFKGFAPPSMLT